jgi:hypothetical protein
VISAVFFKERVAIVSRDANEQERGRADAPRPAASARQESAAAGEAKAKAEDDYAATGMGRRTGHEVTQVWLDLETTPAQSINIRYEFRPQLVRLGILPVPTVDPLQRRERARGFEPGFSPVVP